MPLCHKDTGRGEQNKNIKGPTLAPQVSKLVLAELSVRLGLTSIVSATTLLKGVVAFFFFANLLSSSIPESLAGLDSPESCCGVLFLGFPGAGVEVTSFGFLLAGFSSSESDSEEEEDDSAFLLVPEEGWDFTGDSLGFSSSSSSLELESEELSSAFLPAAGLEAGATGFLLTSGSLSEVELSLLDSAFLAGVAFTGAFLVSSSSLESSRELIINNLSENRYFIT